ncbi:hypothetical protein, partial [Staphylococcus aureus]
DAGGAPGAVVDVEQYGFICRGLSSRCAVGAILAQSGVPAAARLHQAAHLIWRKAGDKNCSYT